MAQTMPGNDSWKTNCIRTEIVRQSIIAEIDEAIQMSGMPTSKNSIEMENHVYQKAKSKEEYLNFVVRLIFHIKEMSKSS